MDLLENRDLLSVDTGIIKIVFQKSGSDYYPPEYFFSDSNVCCARALAFVKGTVCGKEFIAEQTAELRVKKIGERDLLLEFYYSAESSINFTISFSFADHKPSLFEIDIKTEVADDFNKPFQFKALPLIPGIPTKDVRLTAGLLSGWTIAGRTLAVVPVLEKNILPQVAIQTPQKEVALGYGEFDENAEPACAPVCFSYPPALDNCEVSRYDEKLLSGKFKICCIDSHINSPQVFSEAGAEDLLRRDIRQPRYPLQQYREHYLKFLDSSEMFITWQNDFGLFHRGFFNCSNEGSFRKDLGSDADKKHFAGALMYKNQAMAEHEKDPEKYPAMKIFGDCANMCAPLCDVVWGGAHNLQTAYFLFRQNVLTAKAEKIIHTLLHYKNAEGESFQISKGKAKGAWWNAYQPDIDQFSSRYFEPLVGVQDQGLWAHYLCSLVQEKFIKDEEIIKQVTANCEYYLGPLAESKGPLFHACKITGGPGYTREKRPYQTESPFALIMTALGFLSCYRLTGDKNWKKKSEKTALYTINSYYSQFEWGWQEYDTLGQDTMAMGRTLMALCELYKELSTPEIRNCALSLMDYLFSCQHHFNLGLNRYMNNGAAWGGTAENWGGFPHGYTYNSPQGLQTLTFRSDVPEGILACYKAFNSAKAYESLVKYFNLLTYHQVIRKDIPFGYGSSSEHLNMKADYVQDTFQVSNAMPFGIEELTCQMSLTAANSCLKEIAAGRDSMQLCFSPAEKLHFSVSHPEIDIFKINCTDCGSQVSFDGSVMIDNYCGSQIDITAVE
ncbi:MAG: hypothetical protein ACYTFY_09470 [Planctomycetota bacterium]